MAGVRGGNANPGLVARQVGQQGAATEQQAVGQAATLEAEQELSAENALGGVLQNEGTNALQGQSIAQGATAAENSALTTGGLGAEQINAQTAQANANNTASTAGGLISGVGSILGKIFYKGGKVPLAHAIHAQKLAGGGIAEFAAPSDPRIALNVLSTDAEGKAIGKLLSPPGATPAALNPLPTTPIGGTGGTMGEAGGLAGDQGEGLMEAVEANPELALMASHGAQVPSPADFRAGGPVAGTAKVQGDSSQNDTVPAMLSPGEDVLPRSVTMAPDAPERAKRFVEALRDKKGDDGKGYGKVLKAKATLKDRVARLEKLCGGGVA